MSLGVLARGHVASLGPLGCGHTWSYRLHPSPPVQAGAAGALGLRGAEGWAVWEAPLEEGYWAKLDSPPLLSHPGLWVLFMTLGAEEVPVGGVPHTPTPDEAGHPGSVVTPEVVARTGRFGGAAALPSCGQAEPRAWHMGCAPPVAELGRHSWWGGPVNGGDWGLGTKESAWARGSACSLQLGSPPPVCPGEGLMGSFLIPLAGG